MPFPRRGFNFSPGLTSMFQKRGLKCNYSPTKARKPQTSRSARHAGNIHRRASVAPSPTLTEARRSDADDQITVAAQPPIPTNSPSASESTQPVPRSQVASESANGRLDSALYVDRILFSLEHIGTPEEERARYPAGCYSVSRQTVTEHGRSRPRAL